MNQGHANLGNELDQFVLVRLSERRQPNLVESLYCCITTSVVYSVQFFNVNYFIH